MQNREICNNCANKFGCKATADDLFLDDLRILADCRKYKKNQKKYEITVKICATGEIKKQFFSDKEPQSPFAAPTAAEVKAYCVENNLTSVDENAFIDYYESVGWRTTSGRKITDWQSAARNWNRRQKGYEKEKQSAAGKNKIAGQTSYDIAQIQKDATANTTIKGL